MAIQLHVPMMIYRICTNIQQRCCVATTFERMFLKAFFQMIFVGQQKCKFVSIIFYINKEHLTDLGIYVSVFFCDLWDQNEAYCEEKHQAQETQQIFFFGFFEV